MPKSLNITITIPQQIIDRLQETARDNIGRDATEDELREFLQEDCERLYFDNIDDGFITIEDSFALFIS